MEIASKYDPSLTEDKWYRHWMEQGFFNSVPDEREPYTIVIPPPNVTGVLHMGHMLNNTIQDVLVRRARMQGKNACWVPGTDHASIATEAKVVAMLKEKGINKADISREEFLKYAWEWKDKYGGLILDQLKKLGASCDWNRTRFTMEEDLSDAVISVFIDLYNKGFVYRGVRMVNWDPAGKTAVSDEEVIHKEVNSKLYYVKYKIEGSENEWITIATTRPETILGDTAVCVHPLDQRYKHLKGKNAIIPIVNRAVPIIFDEYIDMEFGTGALKVTPAHDINDYNLGVKHKLEVIDTINDDGTMSEQAGFYIGEDRFAVRKKIANDLQEEGYLIKTEDIKNKVGFSERTNAVIEPKLSRQWFVKMDKISGPALENVMNDNIKLVPEKFKNTYRNWMENVHDWCISRQLWWGQQIPAWYNEDGEIVVAKTRKEAGVLFSEKFPNKNNENIKQDEDVLDTWFSSWLWPISVFDGFKDPENPDIKYYYPTNDLVTGPDILFFWVARMIMAGYEFRGEKPFSNVYLTGIVRDKQGRKMSKQLGNSPEPLDLIKNFGADGVRVGMLLSAPAGNDLLFDESLCEQGRNFSNKIWNAFRLIKGWPISKSIEQPNVNKIAISWFKTKFNEELKTINDHYTKYRMSDALMATYKLVWDDFCAWYLEIIKPAYEQPIDSKTSEITLELLENLLKVLHPFIPFISEEIWHCMSERTKADCIIVAKWPVVKEQGDIEILEKFNTASDVVSAIRNLRKEKNIPMKEQLELYIKANETDAYTSMDSLISKLCNLSGINYVEDKVENAFSFLIKSNEYFIPLSTKIDIEAEIEKLNHELEYTHGFLHSVTKKLQNEKFVANAKSEVIETERKKAHDAEAKIKAIEEILASYIGK
ncbi:MAG: valine--tRNA ligase [Bacteroidetes bacterium]|nr:valine--tRNA ligase [Bacteroidota bacterium]HET6243053.1 valine--tRNA ligase [Bacteroidia bacterium]